MAHLEHKSCIDACQACAVACDHCAAACLREPHVDKMAQCIALDMDCAQICQLTAAYMTRDSQFIDKICALCADVCEACGDECAKHANDHCRVCAEACRRCAAECRAMA